MVNFAKLTTEKDWIDTETLNALKEIAESPMWLERLFQLFVSQTRDHLGYMLQAIESQNKELIIENAHLLLGSCRHMGGRVLADEIAKLYEAVKCDDYEKAQEIGRHLWDIFSESQKAIKSELNLQG